MANTGIREIIRKISGLWGKEPIFVTDRSLLQPVLDTLNRTLPTDLAEYLDTCIPTESYGWPAEFHSLKNLIEENRDYVPGADTIKQGFLCLAKEGDGSQFAFCCDDGRVYHIGEEAKDSPEENRRRAYKSWNSLADFLNENLSQLSEARKARGQ